MISATHLTKHYGDKVALDTLTLDIAPGEIFCLLGQNGAGKTTTINCFLAFVQPSAGHAFINGLDVAKHPVESKKYLAYLPEVVMLYPNLTGLENLDYFSRLAGYKQEKGALLTYLETAGLETKDCLRRVSGYSKGMRQKVGIAIALAKKAKALFLDEPTSGLDPKASNDFSKLLLELRNDGVAMLMATHDIFRAKDVANRIGIMKDGRLVNVLDNSRNTLHAKEIEELYLQTI
ncbi:MAG: ATP-binding cassette domain-containing protein [Saprospiraceae bacterium]|nr:ATP-binding cassette domain-containing protein [Saprospiraceae bacterium]